MATIDVIGILIDQWHEIHGYPLGVVKTVEDFVEKYFYSKAFWKNGSCLFSIQDIKEYLEK